jgi:hypothetical protein
MRACREEMAALKRLHRLAVAAKAAADASKRRPLPPNRESRRDAD